MSSRLVRAYRTAEDFRRYTWDSADRRASLASFVRQYRRYIGRSVLDLGCGGGVLGALLAPTGRSYLGVDSNPDMLREARQLGVRVLKADVTRDQIPARFDTVTLMGNALAHFAVGDLDRLLAARHANVHMGSTFLVDYRDLIAMFWQDTWTRVRVTTHIHGKITHRARLLNTEKGTLDLRARPSTRRWVLDWSHAIWSPFILEMVMRHHGWLLVRRTKAHDRYVEVYRLAAMNAVRAPK